MSDRDIYSEKDKKPGSADIAVPKNNVTWLNKEAGSASISSDALIDHIKVLAMEVKKLKAKELSNTSDKLRLVERLKQLDQRNQKLASNAEGQRNKSYQLESKLGDQQSKSQQLESQLEEQRDKSHQLESRFEVQRSRSLKVESALGAQRDKNHQLESSLGDHRDKANQLESAFRTQQDNNQKVESALGLHQDNNKKLTASILEKERLSVEKELRSVEKERLAVERSSALKSSFDGLDGELKNIKREVYLLKNDTSFDDFKGEAIMLAKSSVQEESAAISKLLDETQKGQQLIENKISHISTMEHDLEAELAQIRNEKAKILQKIDYSLHLHDDLHKQKEDMESIHKSVKSQAQVSVDTAQQVASSLKLVEGQYNDLEESNQYYKNEFNFLLNRNEDLLRKNDALDEANKESISRQQNLLLEINSLTGVADRYQSKFEDLESRSRTHVSKIDSLTENNVNLQVTIDKLLAEHVLIKDDYHYIKTELKGVEDYSQTLESLVTEYRSGAGDIKHSIDDIVDNAQRQDEALTKIQKQSTNALSHFEAESKLAVDKHEKHSKLIFSMVNQQSKVVLGKFEQQAKRQRAFEVHLTREHKMLASESHKLTALHKLFSGLKVDHEKSVKTQKRVEGIFQKQINTINVNAEEIKMKIATVLSGQPLASAALPKVSLSKSPPVNKAAEFRARDVVLPDKESDYDGIKKQVQQLETENKRYKKDVQEIQAVQKLASLNKDYDASLDRRQWKSGGHNVWAAVLTMVCLGLGVAGYQFKDSFVSMLEIVSQKVPETQLEPFSSLENLIKEHKGTYGVGAGSGAEFTWPVADSSLGGPDLEFHYFRKGIFIRAQHGADILAVDKGEVVYNGEGIRGYGKLLLLKHEDGLMSIYANNARNHVPVGTKVQRGDVIAEAGRAADASGLAGLYFEVRYNGKAENPNTYLVGST